MQIKLKLYNSISIRVYEIKMKYFLNVVTGVFDI